MSVDKIRFIGNYDFNSQGKFLFEIICQLREMGTGRYVTKNEWLQKWPNQPSYLKIIKVCTFFSKKTTNTAMIQARPAMDRWMHDGKVWGEWTHRGKHLGIYEFNRELNRSDWRLIHKHEEASFLNNKNAMDDIVFNDSFPLPPLQVRSLLIRFLKANNFPIFRYI